MSLTEFPAAGLLTERLVLRPPSVEDAYAMLAYYTHNRAHLRPWEPERPADFYTYATMAQRLTVMTEHMAAGMSVNLLMCGRRDRALVGICNFSNIVRGPLQACHLGFGLDLRHQGQGLMQEALRAAIAHMFDTVGLHRIMANYQPHNARSARVLTSLGFEREGYARSYLHIDGAWRDHVLTALVNPRH
jgi:ribosomal-protein-alanine N-acetyltransferase